MSQLSPARPIVALLYHDGAKVEPVLSAIVAGARARGLRLAGFLQHDRARADRRRCDMALEDLASGAMVAISEDRGADARGCRLDHGAMAHAESLCAAALERGPDLLILNKFGKTEGEGGGFRPLMACAIEAGLPLVIGVPIRNLGAWRDFSGDLARELDAERLPADAQALWAALELGAPQVLSATV